MIQTWTSLK